MDQYAHHLRNFNAHRNKRGVEQCPNEDYPYFKPLIEQTAKAGFNMKEIVADKGYISAGNLQTAVDHGATPYIPFKTNVTGKSGSERWLKLFHY